MTDRPHVEPPDAGPAAPLEAPRLADALPGIGRRFAEQGALGLLVVDGSPLEPMELRYGVDAHERSLRTLGSLVRKVGEEVLAGQGVVARGETGRSEMVLMVPRSRDDGPFYANDLPALCRAVQQRLDRHAQRIAYPYFRRPPKLTVGMAYALFHPRLALSTQLRAALEEARADAGLNSRLVRRDRRRRLLDVIVSGHVKSVYEPIVDARTLTVYGYEALARGPEGSEFASPTVLFPVAEEEGLAFPLDCMCRQKAIEGAVGFPEGAKLFMNIRPSAIHDPSFQPDELVRTLDRCGLGPRSVVFEISEQESIENYDIFREARDEYGKAGFEFALDDTGAGYACLEAAMELAPEYLKVDRAFVHGIDEDLPRQNMVRAFKAMADRMGSRIIGEGLDTLEELQMLATLGIELGQGWLFGKPTPLRSSE